MKNIIILIVFLLGISFLIYWLWSDKPDDQSLKQIIAEEQAQPKVPVRPVPNLDEVEIAIDENGLVLKKLYNQDIDVIVTDSEVKNVEIYDGVMTYSELEGDNWNFKAVNLQEYIDEYLKN